MRTFLLTGLLTVAAVAASADLERARGLFGRTQYRAALQALTNQSSAPDGATQGLIGKSYFMLGDFKKSVEALEIATAIEADNSRYFHWLGKAHGRRAETSNPLLAPGRASKARQAFEKAVALDGKNVEAASDLFSYYLEAPGFLGGGMDKAEALAQKIRTVDPVEYHYAMAQIAEKRKDLKGAETHLREAVKLAPKQSGRIVDLAVFVGKQGRDQESEAIFAQAEKIAPGEPRLLFERASLYIRSKKRLAEAKSLLERYIRSPLTPDDPPRAAAERLLKQMAGL